LGRVDELLRREIFKAFYETKRDCEMAKGPKFKDEKKGKTKELLWKNINSRILLVCPTI
jgi:hypothetical protein